jgi:hypothetical protein
MNLFSMQMYGGFLFVESGLKNYSAAALLSSATDGGFHSLPVYSMFA